MWAYLRREIILSLIIFGRLIGSRFNFILFLLDVEGIHLISGAFATVWAALLLSKVHLFSHVATYADLAAHGGESDWGHVMVTLAILHLVGLFWQRALFQWLTFLLGAFVWAFVAIYIGESSDWVGHVCANTGPGVYGCVAFCNLYGIARSTTYVAIDIYAALNRRKGH